MNNLPGGRLIAAIGSNILVQPLGGGTVINLNVAGYQVTRKPRIKETPHSGAAFGEIFRRKTGEDWQADFKVWWDINNPPDILLQSGWGVSMRFNLGSAAAFAGYGEAQQYYISPCAMLTNFSVSTYNQGDEEVFANMSMAGNSMIFLMPAELTTYSQYLTTYAALGQL